MSIVKNPDLLWDGQTAQRDGRYIEAPTDWQLTVEDIDGQPAPYIYHREKGFNVDANHILANISWAQQVTIPTGEYFVIVQCFSHVTWGNDDFTVGWRVELQTHDQTYKSNDIWLKRQKGDQSFVVQLSVPQQVTGILRVVYRTKWADTNGALDLSKIDIQTQSWGLPVRDTMTIEAADMSSVSAQSVSALNTQPEPIGTLSGSNAPVQQNPAFADAMNDLSAAVQNCVNLAQRDSSSTTIAQCFRLIADALNRAAETLENQNR